MIKQFLKLALLCLSPLLLTLYGSLAYAGLVKGIYITQPNLENTPFLMRLITQSKQVGINTFVVDLEKPSKKSQQNLALVKENNITYVARIVVFSNGGEVNQVTDKGIWEKRLNLINHAVSYGADEIQLDYIRYNTKQKASAQNSQNVFKVIQFFKDQLAGKNIPLQVDVFGITSFGPEQHIGQDLKLISQTVDAICPMVYPSHFEPYVHHAETPYATIYDAMDGIKGQFNNKLTFKLYPYIELSNYRYPLSSQKKLAYIREQIKAVEDSGADGWYAWSPHNKYDNLFLVMKTTNIK